MTVHAAKGLEAPVVILPDTCTTPESGRYDLEFLDAGGVPLWRIEPAREVPARRAARDAAKLQRMMEYRRLLYVALTRPRDRLYVCGYETKRGREIGCWYDLVRTAMETSKAVQVGEGEEKFSRLGTNPDPITSEVAAAPRTDTPLAAWLRLPAAPERAIPPLNPSDFVASSRPAAIKVRASWIWPRSNAAARSTACSKRWRADAGAWHAHAEALAATLIEDRDLAHAAAQEAITVRGEPLFAHLFARGSEGEVPLRGRVALSSGKQVDLLARVDRIVVAPNELLLMVEFKPIARCRRHPTAFRRAVTQLALYARAASALFPNRHVECAVLWTAAPRLDTISSKKLEAAEAVLDPL